MLKDWIEKFPLKRRLTVTTMAVAGIAVLGLGLAQAVLQYRQGHEAALQRLQTAARVIAAGVLPAVRAGDSALAARQLEPLRNEPGFLHYMLVDRGGRPLVSQHLDAHLDSREARRSTTDWIATQLASPRPVARDSGFGSLEVVQPVGHGRDVHGLVYFEADLGTLRAALLGQLALTAAVTLLTLLFAALLARRLHRSLVGPIEKMAESMRRVAEDKDYSVRLETPRGGEVALLADGINAMLSRVQRRDAELRHHRANLEQQISERTADLESALVGMRRAMREAQEARRAAEQASVARSEFLARMSHEIRTPMNGVLGMTELLLDTGLDPRQHRFATTIQNSADSLLAIINDILDFSKIDAGKMRVEQVDFELHALAEEVTELFARHAHQKQVELALDIAPGTPNFVRGDGIRLRQVLTNLVSNALKFTSQGSVIVRLREQSMGRDVAGVALEVEDTGVGIRPESQKTIFDAFVQEDGSISRRFGGTGLGLAISRQLVELMGGRIALRSEPGRGSCFTVTLPLGHGEARERTNSLKMPIPFAGRRALIVDDHPVNREILQRQLTAAGFVVQVAPDAQTALGLVRDGAARGVDDGHFGAPDVLILDGQLPDLDGVGLLRALRAAPATRDSPAVLLSSMLDDTIPEDAAGLAPFVRLAKPVRQSQLRRTLRELLSGAPSRGEDAARAGSETPRASGLEGVRVLLVEDNLINQDLAGELLAMIGCEATVAGNGAEALEQMSAARFDVVLMDCQMPVMDGLTASREWRRRELELGRSRLPIVALTANAMQGDREACLEAGMDDYLSKPFNAKQLREMLLKRVQGAPLLERAGSRAAAGPARAAAEAPAAPPGRAPDPELPVFEPASLSAISALDPDGSRGLVTRIAGLFVEDSARQLALLETGLADGDAPAVQRSAHSLKSSSGNVGGRALSQAASVAERDAHGGDLAAVAARLAELKSLRERTVAELAPLLTAASG